MGLMIFAAVLPFVLLLALFFRLTYSDYCRVVELYEKNKAKEARAEYWSQYNSPEEKLFRLNQARKLVTVRKKKLDALTLPGHERGWARRQLRLAEERVTELERAYKFGDTDR